MHTHITYDSMHTHMPYINSITRCSSFIPLFMPHLPSHTDTDTEINDTDTDTFWCYMYRYMYGCPTNAKK